MDVKGKAGGNKEEAVNNSNSKTPKVVKSQASSKEVENQLTPK
jgi:hypothetical protein